MVVEDDGPTRAMYQAHFERWDMPIDVVVCASAIEALLDIPVVKPQVLIADLRMPGVDGAAMLRQLSLHPLFVKLAVIVVTGLSLQEVQAHGPLPEGTQVVQKKTCGHGLAQRLLSSAVESSRPTTQAPHHGDRQRHRLSPAALRKFPAKRSCV